MCDSIIGSGEKTFLTITFAVEWSLCVFHASVGLIVWRQMRKKIATFTSAFFVIYLCQTVTDCLAYVL
ncbi:hypothetical protein AAVH_05967, partial [Aphelenchoides avenae]